ncbi:hypothetical protein HPG69_005061 [Diceros bicornis minor]|uniref:Uncharacterized protein n=1 Tax=Diceros bicornis minor TaxID=77932 RepID=A0A7J7EEV1_DICBM|nr:hypothetical protein HPG69_005061 [Diceros bicornis minor]
MQVIALDLTLDLGFQKVNIGALPEAKDAIYLNFGDKTHNFKQMPDFQRAVCLLHTSHPTCKYTFLMYFCVVTEQAKVIPVKAKNISFGDQKFIAFLIQILQVQKYMDCYRVPLQSIGLGVSDEPAGQKDTEDTMGERKHSLVWAKAMKGNSKSQLRDMKENCQRPLVHPSSKEIRLLKATECHASLLVSQWDGSWQRVNKASVESGPMAGCRDLKARSQHLQHTAEEEGRSLGELPKILVL